MGVRINTIMQTCFFAISGVLPREEAIAAIKHAIKKTYGGKGEEIVRQNLRGDRPDPGQPPRGEDSGSRPRARITRPPIVPAEAPEFVQKVTAPIYGGLGDTLPVSAMPVDGTFPTGHHAVGEAEHRPRDPGLGSGDLHPVRQVLDGLPARGHPGQDLRSEACWRRRRRPSSRHATRGTEYPGMLVTYQVAPEDCTGCGLCVDVCPARSKSEVKHKAINMETQPPLRVAERENYTFFLDLPDMDRGQVRVDKVKGSQLLRAALRVLRRLRRLRRDPLPQAPEPALRRPRHHRQRHRLLVDLRRQPADHALGGEPRRTRAGLVQLALRGQRRVRFRLPAHHRQAARVRRRAARAGSRRRSATTCARGCSRPTRRPKRGSGAAGAGGRSCANPLRGDQHPGSA